MRDIIGRMRWGMMGGGYAAHSLPKWARAGAAFSVPSTHGNHKTGAGKDQIAEKRMLIFSLNC